VLFHIGLIGMVQRSCPAAELTRTSKNAPGLPARSTAIHALSIQPEDYGKTREGVPYSAFLKVAAPWSRGDLSSAASGYSISGFAIGVGFYSWQEESMRFRYLHNTLK
jgi:hypothetical protein